jgi:hypothetical protein
MDVIQIEADLKARRKACKRYRGFFGSGEMFDVFARMPFETHRHRFDFIRDLLKNDKGVDVSVDYKFTTFDQFQHDCQCAVVSSMGDHELVHDWS